MMMSNMTMTNVGDLEVPWLVISKKLQDVFSLPVTSVTEAKIVDRMIKLGYSYSYAQNPKGEKGATFWMMENGELVKKGNHHTINDSRYCVAQAACKALGISLN
jgi:hypothetical protein